MRLRHRWRAELPRDARVVRAVPLPVLRWKKLPQRVRRLAQR